MKNKIRKIGWLILMCLVWNICSEVPMVMSVDAAGMTAAQKAKAQREKEKAKQAKARAKAKAKAAKEKSRAAAQKSNAKTSAHKSEGRQMAQLSYEEKVQKVNAWNEHVAQYTMRDVSHAFVTWGQVGYSNLFTKTDYTSGTSSRQAVGFQTQSQGWVGGGAGLGYQFRYKQLLLLTGAEFQVYGSRNVLYSDDAKNPEIKRSYATAPLPPLGTQEGRVTYTFADMRDQLTAGYLQVPVMAGMLFWQKRLYFLAGPKVGIGLLGQSVVKTDAQCVLEDPEIEGQLSDMANHGLTTATLASEKRKIHWGLNVAAAAEIGGYVEQHTRLALFAEYGLMNIQSASNVPDDAGELPVPSLRNGERIDAPMKGSLCSSMQTSSAKEATVHPFLIGVKASVLLDIPRKELKPLPIPKEPQPMLLARVVDRQSAEPLVGAGLKIVNTASGEVMNKTTNSRGVVSGKMSKGDYMIKATKTGYYPDSMACTLLRDSKDTLLFQLAKVPSPVVYTLCGRVYSRDKGIPLSAEVKVNDIQDQQTLYAGTATEDGLFVTDLLRGQYIVHLRYPGHMPLDDTIQFVRDTLSFYMPQIKEGIRVKINNLFFATNKTTILPQSESAMEDLAQFMLENASVRICITGHTDSIGSDMANLILSEGRANSVKMDLIARGVDAARITAEGKGESEPIDSNSTEEGRQNNRRVEFTILSTGKK